MSVQQQFKIPVHYDDFLVGDYVADLLVENQVLLEIKAISTFDKVHMAQCMNYLKATGLKICLLINFGQPRVQIKRIISDFQFRALHHSKKKPQINADTHR